ncbi:metallophosphoesterase [Peribacillus frigoritolerans]|uniref:metallophosphoesterase n=1 Tax=Peribacillus frigoritolerans TaxID=450367 RepID=UPI001059A7A4|nr:metallophosphoesterase [Peribacillus frigoritolerans]TDL76481.1 metallophosphoesterase [Peribacillus frigoritolerans]
MMWILIGAMLFFIACHLLFVFPTWWVKIVRVDTPLGLNKTILQLSDFHVEKIRISPKRLKKFIMKEKIDYIFLTGDYLDEAWALPKFAAYLDVLKESSIPVFAVLGNHDYRLPDIGSLKLLFENYQISLLENEAVSLDGFFLLGIDPYRRGWNQVTEKIMAQRHNEPLIVLCHDPNCFEYIKAKYELAFAGHFHGKQINIPFLFKLKPMGPFAEKGIFTGKHQLAAGELYISNGLGQTRWNIRFLVRSEMTIHNV